MAFGLSEVVPHSFANSADLLPTWLHQILRCPRCGESELRHQPLSLVCQGCDASYPVYNGVPMMLRPESMVDTAAVLGQHLGGVDVEAIQLALGTATRFQLRNPTLRGEFTQIIDRYSRIFEGSNGSAGSHQSALPEKVVLKAEYFNPVFETGRTSFKSFRIFNGTTETFATTGDQSHHVSYWLEDETGAMIEGVRSRFPIPLLPNHELTNHRRRHLYPGDRSAWSHQPSRSPP